MFTLNTFYIRNSTSNLIQKNVFLLGHYFSECTQEEFGAYKLSNWMLNKYC